MAKTLDLTADITLVPRYSKTLALVTGGLGIAPNIKPTQLHWGNGTGTGLANLLVLQQRVLGASANESLNFFDGSLLDVFGEPSIFVKLKSLFIHLTAGADGLVIGGAGSNALVGPFGSGTDTLKIELGCFLPLMHPTTGWTIDSTHKLVKILAGASGATYTLLAAGTDA